MNSWFVLLGLHLLLGVGIFLFKKIVDRTGWYDWQRDDEPAEVGFEPNAAWNELDRYIARSQGGQRLR